MRRSLGSCEQMTEKLILNSVLDILNLIPFSIIILWRNYHFYCFITNAIFHPFLLYHPAGDVLWVFVEPGNVVP